MQFDMGSGFIYSPENGSIIHENSEIVTINGIRQGILKLLLEKAGDFVPREEIVKVVWGKEDIAIFNASLTQQIYLLRKDLSKAGLNGKIISHQNEGYKLLINADVGHGLHDHTVNVDERSATNQGKSGHKKILFMVRIAMYMLMMMNFLISSYIFLSIM